ncbi:MAG: hypothetical protein FD135_3370 [Comamonadaceae bacterium]|nr:MAG: hypothetical protein FD135_3370 [Comamonadaceae bacterium]
MRGLSCWPLRRSSRAKVFNQQVDHGPQVTAFFDVHLEQVAHVVQAGCGGPQKTLLLHRSRFGVALHHDQAAQQRAVFTGHFLPGRFTLVAATGNGAALFLGSQQDAPAVFGHLDVAKLGPAAGVNPHGGAQVHVGILEAVWPHVFPPVNVVGLPAFQRTLQLFVRRQVHVVRDQVVVTDGHKGIALDGCYVFNKFNGFAHGVSCG